jgi:hypothetical protein
VVVVLMPLFSLTIIDDFVSVDGHAFDGTRYLHHLAVAAGVAAYVVLAPALTRRVKAHSTPQPGTAQLA